MIRAGGVAVALAACMLSPTATLGAPNDQAGVVALDDGWVIFAGGDAARGSGSGQYSGVTGVAVDSHDNVYVTDKGNQRIHKLSPDGTPLAEFSSTARGSQPRFLPDEIAVDAQGNMYVTERVGFRIEKLSPDGKSLAVFGKQPPSLPGAEAGYQDPRGIAVDSQGAMYFIPPFASLEDEGVRKLSPQGQPAALFTGFTLGGPSYNYVMPTAIAVDAADNVYAPDGADGVVKLSGSGDVLAHFVLQNIGGTPQTRPFTRAISVDPAGNLYVLGGDGVQELSPTGDLLSHWGPAPAAQPPAAYFSLTSAIAADHEGRIYVAEDFFGVLKS
jgi:streptogramin lyase